MKTLKWRLAIFALILCWISTPSEATRRKLKTFNREILQRLSVGYSNLALFQKILEPFLVPRVSGTVGNLNVQNKIEHYMTKLNWTVSKHSFIDDTPYGPKNFTNIIATFDPRAPTRLIVACHFDSKYFRDFEFIAATDSAVPCAMMIDLARTLNCLLNKNTEVPETTLQLLFLDGEEAFVSWSARDSIYGARKLAAEWENTLAFEGRDDSTNMLQTITDFVLLDLIGTSDTKFENLFHSTSQLYEKLYNIEKSLKEKQFLKSTDNYTPYFNNRPVSRFGSVIEDDHIPFMQRNVNILHLISKPFPSVWHTVHDNARALDYDRIDNFNRIFRVFVASYLHLPAKRNVCPSV